MIIRPPRLADWLLSLRLSREWRDFVVGDLHEEFERRAEKSSAAARRWYWGQTMRSLISPPPSRAYVAVTSTRSRGDSVMKTLLSDLRYAARVLFRAPSFTVAVIVVLALGIGANTAIFSMVNAVLLRPLPFDRPDQIVRLFHEPPQSTFPGIHQFSISAANFYDWKRGAHSFERMAIYRGRQFTLTGTGEPEAILAGAVGEDFFEVVGTRPLMGRTFAPDEDTPARGHVVVLSEGFWKSHLAAAKDAVGRSLMLNGEPYLIVGVMPARFSITAWRASGMQIWVPAAFTGEQRAIRDNHNHQVVALLKSGVSLSAAQAEMNAISVRLEQAYPQANAGWGASVIPLKELIVGNVRMPLVIVLSAVGFVLLIACANVGNLLFARALTRRKEIAIRSALGAGRARVFQQLIAESLLLAVVGGAIGLFIARETLLAVSTLLRNQIPRAEEISIDSAVLLFVFGISLLTGLLAGVVPAYRAGRADLTDALREGGRHEGSTGVKARRVLVMGEVALSLVLLAGAGVMLRTVHALHRVDAGYDPHNLLSFDVTVPNTRYPTDIAKSAFFDQALVQLTAIPGVEAVSATDDLPLMGGSVQSIVVDGKAELLPRDQPIVHVRKVLPGLFRTLRIPLLRGRDVAPTDRNVMLISRSAVNLLWPGVDPIGHHAKLPLQSKTITDEVIGIVGDVKQENFVDPGEPTVYEYTNERPWPTLTFLLRTSVPPLTVVKQATQAIRSVDQLQTVEDVRTMESRLDDLMSTQRFSATYLSVFALVALVLASVGIYSVLSYLVRGRTREIGIRTALGAQTGNVVAMVIAEGMWPAAIGIGVGVAAALGAATLLNSLVFGVRATDPITLIVVSVALAFVALFASLLPAFRAARVDPLKILRN